MSRDRTLASYVVLLVVAVGLELSARLTGRPGRLADVLARATRHPWARALVAAGWLWLGWHLFARTSP